MIINKNIGRGNIEKGKQLLEVLYDDNFKEFRIKRKPNNSFMIYATSTKNGKFSEKNILESIKKFNRQNLTIGIEEGKSICLKHEARIKI